MDRVGAGEAAGCRMPYATIGRRMGERRAQKWRCDDGATELGDGRFFFQRVGG